LRISGRLSQTSAMCAEGRVISITLIVSTSLPLRRA
jgi:hypothetical protein